jgi:histidinol-phosphatase
MPRELDIALALDTVRRAAEAAARAAMPHFERGVAVETKSDETPVTAADRDSEAAIFDVIRGAFPGASILSEETGAVAGDPKLRWIVDPLDGTRGFTRGGFFWGPLVALEHEGEIVAGSLGMPALGETYFAARGMGTFKNGAKVSVSTIAKWSEATFSLGELSRMLALQEGPAIAELIRTSRSTRAYGDVGAAAMLLSGRAEAWLEAGVKIWDIAPAKVLIEEAGGRFTSFDGSASIEKGTAVGTNGLLHSHVLSLLARANRS